ncbi:uncharacterized protein LOC143817642 [Ranitomeya variabilis]|uniref:uncharacterized protein LOC143817642 n=1 Tax=Ranitomeya variabilis TaxID=490064 RepID=UPI004057572A
MDQVVLRRLWVEVAKSLWDGFESASSSDKSNFVKKLRTRWRSMKDRFNKGLRNEEEQAQSGAAAAKSVPYKYNRALQFLRPVLGRRQTHSSTLERARPSGADLHESPFDPSQPSHSDSRLAPPSGEPAASPSGVPLPEASGAPSFGNSRQRQRASDRPTMPEFLHLSTVFQNCFKALGDRLCPISTGALKIWNPSSRVCCMSVSKPVGKMEELLKHVVLIHQQLELLGQQQQEALQIQQQQELLVQQQQEVQQFQQQ